MAENSGGDIKFPRILRGEGFAGDLMEKTILIKKLIFLPTVIEKNENFILIIGLKLGDFLVPIVGQNMKRHLTEVCFRTLSFLAIFM